MKRKTEELMQKILVIGLIVLLLFPMPVTAEGIKQLTEGEQSEQDNTIELNEEEVIEEDENDNIEESDESGQEEDGSKNEEESEESGQEEDGSKNENEIDGNTEKITKDKEEEHLEEVLEEKDNEESESNHSYNESTKESKDNVEVIDDNEDIISNKDNEEKEAILNNIKERMRSYTEPASISILSADIPYTEVTSAAQLKNIGLNPSGNYRLMRNINLGPPATFTIDGEFTGRLDGNGYTISNGKDSLFNSISGNAHIRNLRLLNFTVESNAFAFGILADMASGNSLIERVSIEGGSIDSMAAGGIIGTLMDNSIIRDSFSNTTVSGYSAGGVSISLQNRSKILNTLSVSNVNGDTDSGGIVGMVLDNWSDTSTFDTEKSNVFDISKAYHNNNEIGWDLSAALIKDMSYYRSPRSPTPWDFNRIWRMDATLGYPVLKFINSGAPGLATGYDSDRNNYKKSHDIDLSINGTGIGFKQLQYRWTTSSTFPTSGWTTLTYNDNIFHHSDNYLTPTTTGTHYFHARITDNRNNTRTTTSVGLKVDNTLPAVSLSKNGGEYAKSHSTTINVSDAHSGLNTVQYQWTTSTATPTSGWTTGANGTTTSAPTSTGSKYLHIRATDNAGNIRSFRSNAFRIDSTIPGLSLTQTPSGATKGEVTITARGSDSHSGVKRIRQGTGSWVNASAMTFTTAANGTYSFTVEDNAGNTRTSSIVVSNIDTAPPTHVSTSISGERYKSGSTYWVRPADVLTITHRQRDTGSGNARGYLRVTGNSQDVRYFHNFTGTTTNMTVVGTNWGNTSSVEVQSVSRPEHNTSTGYSSAAWIARLLTSGHTYSLQYYYSDIAGNVVGYITSATARVDGVAPTMTITQSPTGATNGNVTLTANGSDTLSGVKRIKLPNGTWVNGSTASQTVSSNGTYSFQVEDNVGNTRTQSITVSNIDKTLPTVSLSKNGGAYATSHSTTITASDTGGSALNTVQYRWTTNTTFPTSGWTTGANGTVANAPASTGNHYLHVRATDGAGNVRNFTSAVFRIDRTAPTQPVITANSGWQTANQSVTVTPGTDGHSGVARTEYRIGSGTWTTYSSAFTVSTNGSTTVQARTIDNAGNTSAVRSATIQIDKTNPTLSLTQNTSAATNGNVIITATGSDSHSGVKRVRQGAGAWVNSSSMTFTATANGTYSFTVEDNAGRTGTASITISNIDKTLPTVSLSKNGGAWATAHSTNINASDTGGSGLSTVQYVWSTSTTAPSTGWKSITAGGSVSAPTTTGTHYLHVIATDGAGNVRNFVSSVFQIDNTNPTAPTITAASGWQKANVSVTIAPGTDGHSGVARTEYRLGTSGSWITYSNAVTVSTNGTTTVQARTVDNAGNISTSASRTVQLDKTLPTVSLSKNGGAWATAHSTTINASDTGGSGLSTVQYAWTTSTTTPTTGWLNGSNGTATSAPTTSGTHYLHVRATDGAGNVRNFASSVFQIDRTNPTAPTITAASGWQKANVSVTIASGTDGHSGTARTEYRIGTGAWTTYSNAVTVSTNGTTTVQARTFDNVGNVSGTTSRTIQIDKIAPSLTLTQTPTGSTSGNVTITATGSDSHSGVKRIRQGTGTWTNSSSMTFTAASNTTYSFTVEDNAGNTTTESITVNNIDKTLPTVSLSKNGGTWATAHSTSINASDTGGSGLSTVQYQWTTSATFPSSGWLNGNNGTATSAPTSTGSHYLHVKATDGAGNVRNFTSAVFQIDNTNPTAPTITAASGWQTSNQSVTIAPGTDGHSGIARTEYRLGTSGNWLIYNEAITISTNGSTTIQSRVIDGAGNISSTSTATIQIDKTNPTLTLTQDTSAATNGNVIITATGSDAHSGVKRIRQGTGSWVNSGNMTFTATANGTYSFTVEDNAGRTGTASITISNIDKTLPAVSLSKNGGTWAKAHSTTINASDSGGSGLNTVQYVWSTSTTAPSTGWKSITAGGSVSAPTTTGTHYLHVIATDNAGNLRNFMSNKFEIDNTSPAAPTITAASGWQKANISVTISSGTDAHSGVARSQYRLNNGTWTNYTGPVTVSTNGTSTVEARTLDNAGNISTVVSRTVQLDKIDPLLSIVASTTQLTNQDVVLTATGVDADSGVKRIKLPNGTWVTGSTATQTVSSNGKYTFTVEDNAGNSKEEVFEVTNIDKVKPTLTITPNTTSTTHEDVVLTITAKDNLSGIKNIQLPDGSLVTNPSTTFNVKENGTYSFTVEDNAGNKHTQSITVSNIDKTMKIDWPTVSNLTSITLSRGDNISNANITPLRIKDWREGNNSWKVNVSSTQLKMKDGTSLPKGAMTLSPPTIEKVEGTGTIPTRSMSSERAIDDGVVELVRSVNARGEYLISFPTNALKVSVDPTTKIGTYEATITWDIVTGP